MKILCFGSLNIDSVYQVEHIVQPGETLASSSASRNLGGKGANQAIAIAKAGCDVFFSGNIGEDGKAFLPILDSFGVDTSLVRTQAAFTGNAIIQVDKNGQNSIILSGGGNKEIPDSQIDEVLNMFQKDDWLVLQNEINSLPLIIKKAKDRGMKIILNPSPFDNHILDYPLGDIDLFAVNEIEGAALAKTALSTDKDAILQAIHEEYPNAAILLTLGKDGACYKGKEGEFYHGIVETDVVDTTAAGDTFLGYFIASLCKEETIEDALKTASYAASITVSRKGAGVSIPYAEEVNKLIATAS